jgi:hypothetical protein
MAFDPAFTFFVCCSGETYEVLLGLPSGQGLFQSTGLVAGGFCFGGT